MRLWPVLVALALLLSPGDAPADDLRDEGVAAATEARLRGDHQAALSTLSAWLVDDPEAWSLYSDSVFVLADLFGANNLTPSIRADGVRAGPVRFWPALSLSGGIDSNPLERGKFDEPIASKLVSVEPMLTLAVPWTGRVGLFVDLRGRTPTHFVDEALKDRNGVSGEGRLRLVVGGSLVQLRLTDDLALDNADDSLTNRAGAELGLSLGPIEVTTGYAWYSDTAAGGSTETVGSEAGLLAIARFDQNLAAFVEAVWRQRTLSPDTPLNTPLRVQAGFTGAISGGSGVLVMLGYGNSLPETGEGFEDAIGRVELQYALSSVWFTLGYRHLFESDRGAAFRKAHRFYATADVRSSPVAFAADIAVELVDTTEQRDTLEARADFRFDWDIHRAVQVSLGYGLRFVDGRGGGGFARPLAVPAAAPIAENLAVAPPIFPEDVSTDFVRHMPYFRTTLRW